VELFFMEVFFMEAAVDSAGDRERWAKTPVRAVPAVIASKTPAADPAHSSATCSDMLLLPPK
jgi:hypothetical protein